MTAEKRHRLRRACSVALIVLVSVLAPLVVTSGWAITTVTNTDRFVSTMSALGSDPTITNYVAEQGAAAVVSNLQVQKRIEMRLPPGISFLAPVITNDFTTALTKGFSNVLESPRFQTAWNKKIRFVHSTFVKLMTTNPAKIQKAANLAIDFSPQVLQALDKLDAKGITVFDPFRKVLTGGQPVLVKLANAKQFKQVQWYFNAAVKLRWILPLIALVLGAAAILLDTRRRRAGIWLSVGVSISCVVMLVLLGFGKNFAVSHASTPPDVANAVFSTLTSFLRWELRAVVLVGALAALTLWVTGPSERARGVRRAVASTSSAAKRKVEGAVGEDASGKVGAGTTSVLGFIGSHAAAFIWGGVAIACLALMLWVSTLGGVLWTVGLTALWVGAVSAARRRFASPALPATS